MRRKNWINKKDHFYGSANTTNSLFFNIFLKKKELVFDEYNTKGQLYKVFINKNKNSLLTPEMNYHFYLGFLNILKKKSKHIIYNNYIKNINKNILFLMPSYTFKSQFFNNKSLFDDVLSNFKLKGFFIHKNYYKHYYSLSSNFYKKHLIGYNYFILKSNLKIYLDFYKIVDDKEYNSVGKVKYFFETTTTTFYTNELNLIFFFNFFILKILEIYKIIIYMYISIN